MNTIFKKFIILPLLLLLYSCNAPGGNDNTTVIIKTTLGDIKIKLYDDTPIHRDNFIKLVNAGIFENVLFHRVIKDFMIQTGDPLTRPDKAKTFPDSVNTFTIPAELNPLYYHKKGALAAARTGNDENPEMRSSGTQFYIVQGVKYNDIELDQAEQKINSNIKQSVFNRIMKHTSDSLTASGKTATEAEVQEIASMTMFNYLSTVKTYKLSEEQRTVYKQIGGVPRLDGTYTVFGEVTEGLDIVDRIASTATAANDKPVDDIRILKIKIVSN
ncbi:MAG: peptidylprolyl isomerase [Bacteroidales bacterium]|nr:peptidylprolyl isomerase [Bacteroidales bacterium]